MALKWRYYPFREAEYFDGGNTRTKYNSYLKKYKGKKERKDDRAKRFVLQSGHAAPQAAATELFAPTRAQLDADVDPL